MPLSPPVHKPPRARNVRRHLGYDAKRPTAWRRGYDREWRKARRDYLADHPLCEEPGCLKVATEVDHIKSLAARGDRLDPANLRAYCKPHHSAKTAREDGAFGRPRRGPGG